MLALVVRRCADDCLRPGIALAVPASFSFTGGARAAPASARPGAHRSGLGGRARCPTGTGPGRTSRRARPSRFATTAYLLYDDKNLYVGFKAEQDGVPIVASQTTNDVGFGLDDFVGIGVDTSGARQPGLLFRDDAARHPLRTGERERALSPALERRGARRNGAWSAVLIIPLDVLRVPRGGKANVAFAVRARHRGARRASLVGLGSDHAGCARAERGRLFAPTRGSGPAASLDLAASAAARPKPRADIYGLASIGEDRNLFQQANGTFLPMNVRWYGGDLSYPLTPTIRFVGTLNPDFSNVEIDQQTIAPQEFQRQLVEYRPFFAQGAAYHQRRLGRRARRPARTCTAPNLVFYSPSVGPFDSGAKVEGTFGDNQSFGALTFHGYDETTNNTFSDQAYGLRARPAGRLVHLLERRRLRQPQHRRKRQRRSRTASKRATYKTA